MKNPEELAAATLACVREHALAGERYFELGAERDLDPIALRGGPSGWSFEVNGVITKIAAQTQDIRDTEAEAFADAVRLRDALLEATGVGAEQARGEVVAHTVQGRNYTVAGWLGLVYMLIPTGIEKL